MRTSPGTRTRARRSRPSQAGEFETDEELAGLTLREFPFYFARYGDDERAYLESLSSERPNADALRSSTRSRSPTFDLRPELARIAAPTLVITGEEDFITGPLCAAELVAGIPGAETVLIPGCGHFIFVEAPGGLPRGGARRSSARGARA